MLARLRSLSLVARFVLVGATVGLLVGAGIAWYLDSELTALALSQTGGRAIDHVELTAAIRRLVWTTVTCGFGLLFAALLLVVRGAGSLIRRHQDERFRLIERAARADALRQADALKNELISVVSHELRTPLTSVVGFTELLLSRGFDETQRAGFLQLLHQESLRLTELVDEFLDLQRIESGRQQLAPVPTDLRAVLTHAVATRQDDPSHRLALDLSTDLPLVQADADQVYQVLANLLSNAKKYSPEGGEVRVSAIARDGEVEVSVADRGLGIPPEAMARLFERFFRIDTSDRRAIRGTGLGLAVVRQIVAAHGGRVWAESEGAGRGARFVFTLPVAKTTADEPPTTRGRDLVPAMGVIGR
ncbi:MAG TPA: ATP-binding protein [Chloroflexota bacterium]|nr:ATP-binding protein [Chloroflexota bacterium]